MSVVQNNNRFLSKGLRKRNKESGADCRGGLSEKGAIRRHPSPPLAGVPGDGSRDPSPLNTNSVSGFRRPRRGWSRWEGVAGAARHPLTFAVPAAVPAWRPPCLNAMA